MFDALINDDRIFTNSTEYNRMLFLSLSDEVKTRLEQDIGWKYLPHRKQLKLHKSDSKIRMLIGGNRAGKTWFGKMEVRWCALDEHPYMDTSWIRNIWVVGLDRTNMLLGTLIPAILQVIPERYIVNFDKRSFTLTLTNGKTIVFKSCDSGEDKFQSAKVDVVWFDEEPDQRIYKECMARTIDSGGKVIITMTPTNGVSWSLQEIYARADDKRITVVKVNMRENPYLPKNEIDDFESSLTPEEKLMRINGDYVVLGGKKVFDVIKIASRITSDIKKPLFEGDLYNGGVVEDDRGYLRIYEKFDDQRGVMFYIGADTSSGMSDATAFVILRPYGDRLKLVAVYERVINPESIYKVALDLDQLFSNNLLTMERQNNGAATLDRIKHDYRGTLYTQEDDTKLGGVAITRKLGYWTNDARKKKMIRDTRDLFDFLDIPDKELLFQMQNYIEDAKGNLRAQTGKDDLVMALMLAVQGYLSLQGQTFKTPTFDRTAYRKAPPNGRAAFHLI